MSISEFNILIGVIHISDEKYQESYQESYEIPSRSLTKSPSSCKICSVSPHKSWLFKYLKTLCAFKLFFLRIVLSERREDTCINREERRKCPLFFPIGLFLKKKSLNANNVFKYLNSQLLWGLTEQILQLEGLFVRLLEGIS